MATLACWIRNPWLGRDDRQTPEELLGWTGAKTLEEVLDPSASVEETLAAAYARQEALRRGAA